MAKSEMSRWASWEGSFFLAPAFLFLVSNRILQELDAYNAIDKRTENCLYRHNTDFVQSISKI